MGTRKGSYTDAQVESTRLKTWQQKEKAETIQEAAKPGAGFWKRATPGLFGDRRKEKWPSKRQAAHKPTRQMSPWTLGSRATVWAEPRG